MFWPYPRIVQPWRDGIDWHDGAIFIEESVGLHAIHNPDRPQGQGRRMTVGLEPMASGFNPY